jgi:hypothetical protein
MMGCYSYLAWYIRNSNSYTVGFVVSHYSKLDFDVKELNNSLTPFEEVIEERDKILQHNKRYQEIEEMPVADYNEEEPLNENDAAIWKEGEKFGIFSYIFDNEKAVLYKPFLHRNEDFEILQQHLYK